VTLQARTEATEYLLSFGLPAAGNLEAAKTRLTFAPPVRVFEFNADTFTNTAFVRSKEHSKADEVHTSSVSEFGRDTSASNFANAFLPPATQGRQDSQEPRKPL
jgi:hypothetical protein